MQQANPDEKGSSHARTWSLAKLLAGLHDDIERRLATARATLSHPGTKGDATEHVWLHLLETYLPQRYKAATAHVVDSKGVFSDRKSAPSSSPTPRRRFRASGAFIAPAVPSPMPEEFIHRSPCPTSLAGS